MIMIMIIAKDEGTNGNSSPLKRNLEKSLRRR